MFLKLAPLIEYRNFRLLYVGQLVSMLGSMITYVALPYQIYALTHSSFAVGMMGVVELIPLLVTAFVGGLFADSADRRRLLIYSEVALAVGALVLTVNATLTAPNLAVVYVTAACMSAVNGFHRPSLDALIPQLVSHADIGDLSPLLSFKGIVGTVCGPLLGGALIAAFGLPVTYAVDVLSFLISLLALGRLRGVFAAAQPTLSPLEGIREGFRYALSRPELMGSYLVDFTAMVFGMPIALFPAVAEGFGGARALGLLYTAPSVGALLATVFSGWTRHVRRQGAAIAIAAALWGVMIGAFGLAPGLGVALFFLVLSGVFDSYSGIFRLTLWNETIPTRMRGRLAGIEMISYMSGPLLGNAESGLVASAIGAHEAIVLGGALCVLGVVVCVVVLRGFWGFASDLASRRALAQEPAG